MKALPPMAGAMRSAMAHPFDVGFVIPCTFGAGEGDFVGARPSRDQDLGGGGAIEIAFIDQGFAEALGVIARGAAGKAGPRRGRRRPSGRRRRRGHRSGGPGAIC